MAPRRATLTIRSLAVTDSAASLPPPGGSAAERLAMVHELSQLAWRLTGRPLGPGPRAAGVAQLRALRAPSGDR